MSRCSFWFSILIAVSLISQSALPVLPASAPSIASVAESRAQVEAQAEDALPQPLTSPVTLTLPVTPTLAITPTVPVVGAALAPGAPPLQLNLNLNLGLNLNLDLALSLDPPWAAPGDVVTATVAAHNLAATTLPGLTLTTALPAGLLYVAQSGSGFALDPRSQQLTWPAGDLSAGAVITGSFQVHVQGVALGATITDTVTATCPALATAVTASAALEVVAPRNNEAWVTPEAGGQLRSSDDRLLLRVPPGAVAGRTLVRYARRPDLADRPSYILTSFALAAQDERGQAVSQFAAPLTLRLARTPAPGAPMIYSESGLFTLDEARGQWLALPAEVEPATGYLRADLRHFSIYAEGDISYVVERMSSLRGAQTNLFTRAIGYSAGFELPPGRGGLTPVLGLSYSSGNHTPASGHFSLAGFGWELSGADSVYTAPGDAHVFLPTLSLQGAIYSLRRTADGTWFAKENPFLKVQAADVSQETPGTWYVWTPDGMQYTFSAGPTTSEYYWKLCGEGNQGKRYVRVPLTGITDPHGNTSTYTWKAEADNIGEANCPTHYRGARLSTITYNGGTTQVKLDYAARSDRPNGYDNATWPFYTTQRLSSVTVQVKENGAGTLRTVRSYALSQSAGPATALSQKVLNLDWLEERSAGGSALPRTEFSYTDDYFESESEYGALNLVRNGYGGEVAFQSQNRDSNANKPHVVSARTERDGIAGTSDATWHYASSAWDATGETLSPKLAQGYSEVTVTAPTGTVEQHDFIVLSTVSNGQKVDHLAGRETQRIILAGAAELAKTVTTWVSTTQSLPLTGYDGMSEPEKPRFIYAGATQTFQDGQRRVRTENEYQPARQGASGQQYGNLTEQREYAGTASGWETLPTRTRYAWFYPNTSAWLINKPAQSQMYQVCNGCVGGVPAEMSVYYYDYATSETTPPTGGLLTQQRTGVGAEQITAAEYDYWPNGNLRWAKDGRGNRTDTFYDSAFQVYPVCVKDALNQTTVTRYYGVPGATEADCLTTAGSLPWSSGAPLAGRVFGQVEDTTDANGAVTSRAYDAWGRVTQVWLPGESQANNDAATRVFVYIPYSSASAPFKVQQRQRADVLGGNSAAAYLDRYTFYDGLGQVIQTQVQAAASAQLILTQTGYNGVGQVVTQTVPALFTATLGVYRASDWTQPQTRTAYDGLGRTTAVTSPDGATTENRYTVEYNPADPEFNLPRFAVYTIDANRHFVRRASDIFGNLRVVSESTGSWPVGQPTPVWGDEYRTRYTYDVAGRLLTVQDHAGSHTMLTYDSLGRKTAMTDPDMGAWSYDYDNAGNLKRQTDAKNQTTCFYYDGLNRLKGKMYPSDTDCLTPDPGSYEVSYGYDSTAGGNNGKGRRTSMTTTGTGTNDVSWVYDARGRVTSETRTIGGAAYSTGYGYDAADRVRTTTYPDGEAVITTYDAQGLPNGLSSGQGTYVSSSTYDAEGRLDLRVFQPNGLQTDYVYYSWAAGVGDGGRLQQSAAVSAAGTQAFST